MLPDGRLASGSEDNTIRLWDVTPAPRPPASKGTRVSGQARCALLPDGRLASGSDDNTIRLWDVATPAPRPPASKGIRWGRARCALLPDGRLASGSWDNTIRLWDVTTGAETARLEGRRSFARPPCPTAASLQAPLGVCIGWRWWTERKNGPLK